MGTSFSRLFGFCATEADKACTTSTDLSFYPTCNEAGQAKTLSDIPPSVSTQRKKLHLGFSISFNHDLIAHRQPEFAIVADIAPRALKYYEDFSTILVSCSSRQQFAEMMQTHLEKHSKEYFSCEPPITFLCDLTTELTREGSWLFTDKGFETVKAMHVENRIYYVKLNLIDEEKFATLSKWITEEELHLDTVYVSNIPEWLHPSNAVASPAARSYLDNIRSLLKPTTYVVDAFKRFPMVRGAKPEQRTLTGAAELPVYERTNTRNRESLFSSSL